MAALEAADAGRVTADAGADAAALSGLRLVGHLGVGHHGAGHAHPVGLTGGVATRPACESCPKILVPAGGRILRSRDDFRLVMRGGDGQSREPVRRVQDWLLSKFRGLDRQLAAMGVEVLPF